MLGMERSYFGHFDWYVMILHVGRFYCIMWRIMKFFQFLFTVAGLSWILGFMTRWGVHHYYIDSRGHCVTPVPYQYDHETAEIIMEEISVKNIQRFFDEFSSVESHQIGSVESYNYAKNISGIKYACCVF